MRRRLGIVALVLAVAFLAAVPAIRSRQEHAFLEENRRYEAAHYFAHLRVIDADTSEPIPFEVSWDIDSVTPVIYKGSGPSVVESMGDGSKVISIVGVRLPDDLRVEVGAPGYHSSSIRISPTVSGVLEQEAEDLLRTVLLEPVPSKRVTE